MDNDNSRRAAMLRNMAIMMKRFDDDYDSQTLCTEFNCGGIDCDECVMYDGSRSARELNEIADILDGKDV